MNRAEKKFRIYAVAAIFVLLTILLGIMNAVNFTMASQDADRVTQMLEEKSGGFMEMQGQGLRIQENPGMRPEGFGPMGPEAPDMNASLRYFTVSFDESGNSEMVEYHISAVSESEAVSWAESLVNESTGWSHGTYRYRVFERDGLRYVTVIDQGREMISAYRVLVYSLVGIIVVVVISWIFLTIVGRKLFSPIDEAERKQKQFIASAEKQFKIPLTVISADTEILERENGLTEQTTSIRRQVRKMDALVQKLGSLSVYEEEQIEKTSFNLSDICMDFLDQNRTRFSDRGLVLSQEITENVMLLGDPESFAQVMKELIENSLKYGREKVLFRLSRENGRIRLSTENPCGLPDGSVQQVFDRFTTLQNADDKADGLGLAGVKDIVKAHNGRVSAAVKDGSFTVTLEL